MIASEIKKRTAEITTELVRCKRLDPNVYEKVVSTLAHMKAVEAKTETEPDDPLSGK